MKKILATCILFVCCAFFVTCNRDDLPDTPDIPDTPVVPPIENTVTDIDGNVYNMVQIGDQCWMKENLRTTRYADGTSIPVGDDENWGDTDPYYYDYHNSSIPLEERGYLYNWTAAMHGESSSDANPSGVQGVCPDGWHLPSDAEWKQLMDYVGSHGDYVCGEDTNNIAKALASTMWWHSNGGRSECLVGSDPNTNNASGFGAVPAGGWIGWLDEFRFEGYDANFWTSTESASHSDCANIRELDYYQPNVLRLEFVKRLGFSVRCLRD